MLARTLGREVRNRLRKLEKKIQRDQSLDFNDGETPSYGRSLTAQDYERALVESIAAFRTANKPLRGKLVDKY